MSWSTSELRVRLAHRETGLSPSVKYFYWPFQGIASFVDHLCYFCLVFVKLSCASVNWCLVVTCWDGLTSWLSFVMSNCEVVTFPLVSWVRCGAWLYRFLIFVLFLTFTDSLWYTNCYLQWLDMQIMIFTGSLYRDKSTSITTHLFHPIASFQIISFLT